MSLLIGNDDRDGRSAGGLGPPSKGTLPINYSWQEDGGGDGHYDERDGHDDERDDTDR